MTTTGDSWFVVLPDHEGAASAAADLEPQLDQWVAHPSGRPWLLARTVQQDVIVTDTPAGKLAVIGHCPVTASELAGHAAHVSTLSDLDRLATRLPGSFHLLPPATATFGCRAPSPACGGCATPGWATCPSRRTALTCWRS